MHHKSYTPCLITGLSHLASYISAPITLFSQSLLLSVLLLSIFLSCFFSLFIFPFFHLTIFHVSLFIFSNFDFSLFFMFCIFHVSPIVASRADPPKSVFSGQGGGLHALHVDTDNVYQGRHPKSAARRCCCRPKAIKREPPRSSPESRRVQTVTQIKGGCTFANLSMMIVGVLQTRRTARWELAMSVMFACHLVLRVLEITPASNALVPCAWDNTQRSLLRRQPLLPFPVRNDRLLLSLLQSREAPAQHVDNFCIPDWQPPWSCDGRCLGRCSKINM